MILRYLEGKELIAIVFVLLASSFDFVRASLELQKTQRNNALGNKAIIQQKSALGKHTFCEAHDLAALQQTQRR